MGTTDLGSLSLVVKGSLVTDEELTIGYTMVSVTKDDVGYTQVIDAKIATLSELAKGAIVCKISQT